MAHELLEELLDAAATCLMGDANPPCHVYVLQARSRAASCERICAIHDAIRSSPSLLACSPETYDEYLEKWFGPYVDRRRENGWGQYGLLGIGKTDKCKLHAQHLRNHGYFDAPLGMVFTMDQSLGGEQLLACLLAVGSCKT